jgi:hypothetical protein
MCELTSYKTTLSSDVRIGEPGWKSPTLTVSITDRPQGIRRSILSPLLRRSNPVSSLLGQVDRTPVPNYKKHSIPSRSEGGQKNTTKGLLHFSIHIGPHNPLAHKNLRMEYHNQKESLCILVRPSNRKSTLKDRGRSKLSPVLDYVPHIFNSLFNAPSSSSFCFLLHPRPFLPAIGYRIVCTNS